MPLNDPSGAVTFARPASEQSSRCRIMPPPVKAPTAPLTGFRREATSARYCYAVWMRHLVRAEAVGDPPMPQRLQSSARAPRLGLGSRPSQRCWQLCRLDSFATPPAASQSVFEDLIGMLAAQQEFRSGSSFLKFAHGSTCSVSRWRSD